MRKLILKGVIVMSLIGTLQASSDSFVLKIGSFEKTYPMKEAQSGSGVKIAYVNDFVDNMDLIRASADGIVAKLEKAKTLVDIIVIPGDKANALGAVVVERLGKVNPKVKLIVFRATNKGGNSQSVTYQSISSDKPKKLFSRPDHGDLMKGKNVIILDDVISTGATARASADLATQLGGKVIGFACAATEGETNPSQGVEQPMFAERPLFTVTHFPVIKG